MNQAPNPVMAPPETAFATPDAQALQPEEALRAASREARLRDLLGVEYDYARDSGLVDLFEYDPKTGEDGLTHILAGDIDYGQGNVTLPGGFHHEESGRVWGTATNKSGDRRQVTRVDREHLESGNSAHRKKYRERPAEPYLAQVAIGDRPKLVFAERPEGTKVEPAKNSMYPKEYDPLAVMQSIRTAYENMDPAQARPGVDDKGRDTLVVEGEAVMIDGVSKMPIRMVLNPESKRIRTAYPLIKGGSGIMNLTEQQMWEHATYQTPTSSLRR